MLGICRTPYTDAKLSYDHSDDSLMLGVSLNKKFKIVAFQRLRKCHTLVTNICIT